MRLRLTKRTDYAIRACVLLAASPGAPVPGRLIAERMAIPDRFLPQVLADLVRAEIVQATVGKRGGYALRRDPGSLPLIEVIECVEGPSRSEQCVLEERRCDVDRACALHPVWSAAQSAFIHVLATTTVADIAPDASPATPPPVRSVDRRTTQPAPGTGPTVPERIPA
jgi:Rrf2 family protein